MRQTALPMLAVLLALPAGGWGCDRVLSVPTPPDLEELAATYEQPTGSLVASALSGVLDLANKRLRIAEDVDRLQVITEVIDELRGSDELPIDIDGGVERTVRPRLVANLEHICRGPAGYTGEPDAEAHGTLTLTLVAGAEGVAPGVFGAFDGCVGHRGSRNFTLDGEVNVLLEQLDGQRRLLVEVEGSLETAQDTFSGKFDFRLREGGLEVRVPLSSGDVIAALAQGGQTQVLRDRVATWACRLGERRCRRMDTDEVLEAE